jgi:hypothetical protein
MGAGAPVVGRSRARHLPALLVALVFMTIEGAALGAFAWLVRPLFEGLFDDSSMDGVIWVGALIAGFSSCAPSRASPRGSSS